MAPTNLDMDVLRTLVVAIELGGFGRAAERLGRSQSAISLQIRRLEAQVGRPLFRKQGRGLALTNEGDILLGYARRILELNDEAMAAASGVAIGGAARLGLPQGFAEGWLPPVLSRFARAHPAVHIEARIDSNAGLIERITHGQLDLALIFGASDAPGALPVAELPMVWIAQAGFTPPPGAPLPLLLFEPPCIFREAALGALERARLPWRLALTSPSLAGLWAAAAAGLGLTVRMPVGLPPGLAMVDAAASGLPRLPRVGLALHTAGVPSAAVVRLREILLDELRRGLAAAAAEPLAIPA